MNTAENRGSQLNERQPSGDSVPVLARVPWLVSAPVARQHAPEQSVERCPLDANFFEAHSVMAAADLGVSDWDVALPQLRVDPPQPRPTATLDPEPAHSSRLASVSANPSPAGATPPVLPTPSAPTATHAPDTYLRFDPPGQATVDHVAASRVAASSQASTWHQRIATIDNVIRQYHKVIMLAALLTAAGLMMLVLESQHPTGVPAPESTSPSADQHVADVATPPADSTPEAPKKPTNDVAQARGPQSDARRRTSVLVPGEMIPLEPLLPDATASADEDDEQVTPIIAPFVDEPCDWTAAAGIDTEPAMVIGYPATNEPAFVWPQANRASSAPATPPNVARLSSELQSANTQATK